MRGTGFHDLERDLRPAPQGILAFGDRRADCATSGHSPTASRTGRIDRGSARRDVHCWTPPRTDPGRARFEHPAPTSGCDGASAARALAARGPAPTARARTLGPVRALLVRVPPCGNPRSLAPPPPPQVSRLCSTASSYYGGVRLLLIVHRRLRLLTFPPRTIWPRGPMADQEISLVPVQGACAHARFYDHAGPSRRSRWRV